MPLMTGLHEPCGIVEFKTLRNPMCGSASQSVACRKNWFNVWSSKLATVGLPPTDTVRQNDGGEHMLIHYQFSPAMDELVTPQMGLDPGDYTQVWTHDSEAVSVAGLEDIMCRRGREIIPMMKAAVARVTERAQTFNDYGGRDAVLDTLAMEFLRIKGNFAACPFCLHRANWLTQLDRANWCARATIAGRSPCGERWMRRNPARQMPS
jgi:hypothetical protein